MKLFKEGFETMSALLAVALLVNLAARVAFAAMEWRHVDKGKYQKTKFLIGALVYMVEYNTGQRMMKATLKEKQRGGQQFDTKTQKYVRLEMDAVAVKASREFVAGNTLVRTTALMLATEDLPALGIQAAYLYFAEAILDFTFALAIVATGWHVLQQGSEAYSVSQQLPELGRIAKGRDKFFDDGDLMTGGSEIASTDEDVYVFANECREVCRSVDLAKCKLITDDALLSLGSCCPNLRSVTIDSCDKVTDVGLLALLQGCRRVHTLDLRATAITDDGLRGVAEHCTQLTSLDLHGCKRVTDEGVRLVAHACGKVLKELDLSTCKLLTVESHKAVAHDCRGITDLNLHRCNVTDAGLHAIAQKCHHVVTLDLSNNSEVTNQGLKKVVEECRLISTLDLSTCTSLSSEGLLDVARHCTQLTSLDLSGNELDIGEGLRGILEQRGSSLANLDLSYCLKLEAVSFHAIADHCASITWLSLANCKTAAVTDDVLLAIGRQCKRLTFLDVRFTGVTEYGVKCVRETFKGEDIQIDYTRASRPSPQSATRATTLGEGRHPR